MNEELELLRNVQASYYESLKMKKEHQVSEKSDSGASETGLADYENFQMLNQTMQQEILQLRAYIDQQQNMIQVSTKFIFQVLLIQTNTQIRVFVHFSICTKKLMNIEMKKK